MARHNRIATRTPPHQQHTPSWRRAARALALGWAGLLIAATCAGCVEERDAFVYELACRIDAQCPRGQACHDGVCLSRATRAPSTSAPPARDNIPLHPEYLDSALNAPPALDAPARSRLLPNPTPLNLPDPARTRSVAAP